MFTVPPVIRITIPAFKYAMQSMIIFTATLATKIHLVPSLVYREPTKNAFFSSDNSLL